MKQTKAIKKTDSENRRTHKPTLPSETSRWDDVQIDKLKAFKHSRPMYQEEAKYLKQTPVRQAIDPPYAPFEGGERGTH